MMKLVYLVVVLISAIFVTQAEAKRERHVQDANGNETTTIVKSGKTGATAQVSAKYVSIFQAYVNDLEAAGAAIRFMGGFRRGHCSSSHMHPCGRALDVCQLRRGVVDRRCNLPDRPAIAAIAARHGLVEGGRWHNSDYGHAQVGGYSGADVADMKRATTITLTAHSRRRTRHRHVEVANTDYAKSDWQQFNSR